MKNELKYVYISLTIDLLRLLPNQHDIDVDIDTVDPGK